MLRKQMILTLCLFGLSLISNAQERSIKITRPIDGETVTWRLIVEGAITGNKDAVKNKNEDQVWVVIHPIKVSDYWVQPKTSVRSNGQWTLQVYIGRKNQDFGDKFEMRAVANPKETLKEGLMLTGWPEAEMKSDTILVTREKK
jgi:hypothetical protein